MIKKLFVSGAVSASALILTGCVNDYGENLESVMNAKTEATTITANVTIPERTYAEESEAELPAAGEVTETSAEIITFPKTETEMHKNSIHLSTQLKYFFIALRIFFNGRSFASFRRFKSV